MRIMRLLVMFDLPTKTKADKDNYIKFKRLQGSCINCEVTLTVNGKSKTFVPKAICNGKLSDGIYVRPRIG